MTGLLTFIVVVLAIIAVVKVVRVMELATELSGDDDSVITRKDNRFNGVMFMIFLVLGVGAMVYFT